MSENSCFLPWNFLGLPDELCGWEKSAVGVLPVPYDLTASYRPGARFGPQAIIAASRQVEYYDEELGEETCQGGIHKLPEMEPVVSSPPEMLQAVEKQAARIVKAGKLPVMLGGEHTLAIGMVRALAKEHPGLSVLQLDAHADLRPEYQGSPYSHACTGRRLAEIAPLVQVGVRSLSQEESQFLAQSRIETCFMRTIREEKDWEKRVLASLRPEVYITVDLDVLDPSLMPAVGTPEPGGMDWYGLLGLVRLVGQKRSIIGFDIVELTPQPGNPAPDFLAAKLAYRIMGYARRDKSTAGARAKRQEIAKGGEDEMGGRDKAGHENKKKAKRTLKEKRQSKKERRTAR